MTPQPFSRPGPPPPPSTPPEDLPPSYTESASSAPPPTPPPTTKSSAPRPLPGTDSSPALPPPSYSSITVSSLPRATCTPCLLSESKQTKVLNKLLKTHHWPRSWGPVPRTLGAALKVASLHGSLPLVSALITAGAEISYSTRFHARRARSAIHEAARGPEPRLALMLVRCCDVGGRTGDEGLVSARDEVGRTPLHFAASAGRTDVAEGLLGLGAEVDVADDEGRTPLFMAARYRRGKTVRYLAAMGADAGKVKKMWAGREVELGSWDVVQEILEAMDDEEVDRVFEQQNGARKLLGLEGRPVVKDEDGKGKEKHPGQGLLQDEDQAASSSSKPLQRRRTGYVGDLDLNSPTWTTADPSVLDVPSPEVPHFTFTTQPTSNGSNPVRDFDTRWDSPQYATWVSGMETVQDEVREQRARLLREAKYAD